MEPINNGKGSALPQASVVKKKGITIEKTVIENYYTLAQTVHINNKEYSVKCFFPKNPKYGEKDLFTNAQINSQVTRKLQETVARMTEYAIVFGLGNDDDFSSIMVQGDYLTRRYDNQPRPVITPLKATLKAETEKADKAGNKLLVQSLDKLYHLAVKAERVWETSEQKRVEEESKLEEFEHGFELLKLTPVDENGKKIPKEQRLPEPKGVPVGQIVYLSPVYPEEYERELDDEELHDDAFVKMDYRKEQEQQGIFKRIWKAILNKPEHPIIDPDPKPAPVQKKPAAAAAQRAPEPVKEQSGDSDSESVNEPPKPLSPRVRELKKPAAHAVPVAPPPPPIGKLPVSEDAPAPEVEPKKPAAVVPPPPPPPRPQDKGDAPAPAAVPAAAVPPPPPPPPSPPLGDKDSASARNPAEKPVAPQKAEAKSAAVAREDSQPDLLAQIRNGAKLKAAPKEAVKPKEEVAPNLQAAIHKAVAKKRAAHHQPGDE